MNDEKKPSWVERVKHVALIHKSNLEDDENWTLQKTAKLLDRSVGRISEDLMLARYMKTHPRVETFSTVQDALEYCRRIKKHERLTI